MVDVRIKEVSDLYSKYTAITSSSHKKLVYDNSIHKFYSYSEHTLIYVNNTNYSLLDVLQHAKFTFINDKASRITPLEYITMGLCSYFSNGIIIDFSKIGDFSKAQ